ncbi:hypothetical protein [Nostoc sp. UHCC 0251]|uniref:hypothetical protein n=1 Tax=Nostoc sp. UHCC 0251 TaxID=3110240 RepID=UPI002B1FEE6C|nr:hypothetical protein [Nostoc sp. UHCC 0251]MEA5621932.1 hypothetical protein [Nostoc sp. UHCC 0251]
MDNNLQIDNVQSFVKAIGDNDKFWRLLHKKEVSRLKEEVKYKDQKRNISGVKYYTQGKVYAVHELETSEMSIEVEYRDGLIFRYKKEQFIRKFSNISPPISRQEIFELVRSEQEAKDAQKWKAEKQILLEKVKNQFEQNFLNVDNFYQAECTEYISFQEYQTEKLNYVQSWVQNNLNSTPDLEQNGTYAIRDLLNAEGYRWRTIGWSAWCCTYPAQDFSIQQYFDNAQWISHACGIEVRFYDDLENMLAKYHVDSGQFIPVINNLSEVHLNINPW